ncbi:MAG: carboxylating nicotinate-nucleotide diphosphorylase [Halobacteriales archaeon]
MVVTDRQVEEWLREDIGHNDVTNDVPGETTGRLVAKESGVLAGIEAAVSVFEYLGVEVTDAAEAGDRIAVGDAVLAVEGAARAVLRGERTAVNVAAHASGIATRTRAAVEAARTESEDVRIACTRKTTPGLRGVEKRAVAAGGGDTHRVDLSHMVMVKDNHIAEMGLEGAVGEFSRRASFTTKVEVEAETPEEARRAADAGADIVLLDNMTPEEIRETIGETPGETLMEASGGITIEDVPAYAATGVDVISMGSLTHSAPALDYSFRTG